jgi:hypothetical protein
MRNNLLALPDMGGRHSYDFILTRTVRQRHEGTPSSPGRQGQEIN